MTRPDVAPAPQVTLIGNLRDLVAAVCVEGSDAHPIAQAAAMLVTRTDVAIATDVAVMFSYAAHRGAQELACIGCGCTELAACPDGCSWVSLDPPICSGCG